MVFEGIVNPEHMTKYFISQRTGRLESGKELVWQFPEFEDKFPITQIQTETDRSVSFVRDQDTVVTITLEKVSDNDTLVRVIEKSKDLTEENLKWALGNSGRS